MGGSKQTFSILNVVSQRTFLAMMMFMLSINLYGVLHCHGRSIIIKRDTPEMFPLENKFIQPEVCIDGGNIANDYLHQIRQQNKCAIIQETKYFRIHYDDFGYPTPTGFMAKTCLPINCGDTEDVSKNCRNYVNMTSHPLYIRYSDNQVGVTQYLSVANCIIPPTNKTVIFGTLQSNKTIEFLDNEVNTINTW
ncbi:hypothetical protein TrispH2_011962 [Trichoplax sp. H2]|nr:hypothetical protein TrispH2_011962 [Trichoplax sp. H2]|eukprot:RDD36191.1 hypothetical protein TrispH2_011962 [Trichoplax sp. H2]